MFTIFLITIVMASTEQPRQVKIFYQPQAKKLYQQQLKELEVHDSGIKERDILVSSFMLDTLTADELQKTEIDSSRHFLVVLIGRDGGEKFRADRFVTAKELFAIIDAMPMRRAEMKKGKSVKN